MRREELARIGNTVHGFFGLFCDWYTVERNWLNNQPGVSCIPAAVYVCRPTIFHPGQENSYKTFEITNVPNRSEIKIHIANWSHQLEGCVGLGTAIQFLQYQGAPKLAVSSSKVAFNAFMEEFGDLEEWEIDIRDYTS